MKNTFFALALTAAFIGCEKPNRSPIIKDLKLSNKELGAEVNVGESVSVDIVAEDDSELARYQIYLVKGAVNEVAPITHPGDYSFGNGDNISGSQKTFSVPVSIPANASPGAYQIQVEVKDFDGKISTRRAQTLNVVNPNNSLSVDIQASTPGPASAQSNTIYSRSAQPITIFGAINSTVDIAKVKFFMATDNYVVIERSFEFPANDDFSIDFKDIMDELGTQYKPMIPGNISIGQQLEFIVTAVDANGSIASKAYGISITPN